MFIDTEITEVPNCRDVRPSAESLLKLVEEKTRAKLRVYIGAAAGVGKTFQMLEDAQSLLKQGIDVVIGTVETHGRSETAALLGDLEIVPKRKIEYKGVTLEEMDLQAIIERRPAVVIVDELAHTNAPTSKNQKRYEDVKQILAAGINVLTAVNVQHLESLNDVVARTTGVRVRETVPDCFLKRADEVLNIDVSVDTLRTRLRQGKIYGIEKIEQSLNNFFRKGNLAALRELSLRQVADHQSVQNQEYRTRENLAQAVIPEKVMVCLASRGSGKKLLRVASRIAGKLANDWFAVYVETPEESPSRIKPKAAIALRENLELATELNAKTVHLKGENVADELIKFAKEHSITHVIFGQSARSRWEIFWRGSIINRFLREVKDATVQVVPIETDMKN